MAAGAAMIGLYVVTSLIPDKKEKTPAVFHPEDFNESPPKKKALTKPPPLATLAAAESAAEPAAPEPAAPEPVVIAPTPAVVVAAPAPVVVAAPATPVVVAAPVPVVAAPTPVAAAPTAPVATVTPSPSAAATAATDACTPVGTSGGWRVFLESGSVYASSRALADEPPVRLTPSGVGVGAVMVGSGELLVELDGYTPGAPSLHRIVLPPSDAPPSEWLLPPTPTPDTASPAGARGGVVRAWITSGQPLGALGALVAHADGTQALYLRQTEPARVGSAAWLATCRRLGLPDPPVDPNGPTIYTEWRPVAEWDTAVELLGFANGTAWVHHPAARTASGYTADGAKTDLPL